MDQTKFFCDYPNHIKTERPDSIEDAFAQIKFSHSNGMLYPYIPLIPYGAFKTDPDPENPHCKRKSHPLEMCPICKKYFRRMSTHLQKHGTRSIVTSLTCRYCFKHFTNLGNLSIHLRTHTGSKPYVCDICSKAFAQSCNLTNHKRVHTGERPFKCPHCERSFTQSGNLSNHIRLHLDLKPFKCHYCEKAFTQSGNLSTHLKNNHTDCVPNARL